MGNHAAETETGRPRSPEDRKRIERELFEEVISAREQYAAEVKRCKEMVALTRELGLENSGSLLPVTSMVQVHKESLKRYSQAVRTFNDFILYKKLPPKTHAAGGGE